MDEQASQVHDEALNRKKSLLEVWLSGWMPVAWHRFSDASITFYLAFVPTGVLETWLRSPRNEVLSWLSRKMRMVCNVDDCFFYLLVVIFAVWCVDIVLRLIKWIVHDRKRKREYSSMINKIEKQQNELDCIRSELETLQHGVSEIFHKYLMHLSEVSGCGNSERLSLYVVCKAGEPDNIELMRRYSENGSLGKLGRPKDRIDEGVIGKAWESKYYYLTNLPDPGRDFTSYKRQQMCEFGYSETMVKNFSMKARTYFAYKVSQKDRCVGFLVVESLANKFKDESSLYEIFCKHNDFLYFMLEMFKNKVPTYDKAMKENF